MVGLRWMMVVLLAWATPLVAAENQPAPTEVVVLGVDHTAQLVNRRQQPAAVRAFLASVSPAAICIERSPERFARGDHYEFTYEIQNIVVPWARKTRTPLCPFDWLPSADDSALALGIDDLERPPLLRSPSGFQGFLTFPDPETRTAGLFYADGDALRAKVRTFYTAHPEKPGGDFARRLFLYRTFLQARGIERAAREHPGGRLLVVVGHMHKDDIEGILASYPRIRVIQPSAIAKEPTAADILRHQKPEDLFAIGTFNLLGMESRGGAVDLGWMQDVVRALEQRRPGAETRLLATRLAELRGMGRTEALKAYLDIADRAGTQPFTWDGVKDRSRIDSFFDPFGNLTVGQRARLEAARLQYLIGRPKEADAIRNALRAELKSSVMEAQFDGYWTLYVAPAAGR